MKELKDSASHEDKTQAWLGVTRLEDQNGNRIGRYEVWVNPELLCAKIELTEDEGEDVSDGTIPGVVHIHSGS